MSNDKKDIDLQDNISATILAVATQRGVEKSTCPSEIAACCFLPTGENT